MDRTLHDQVQRGNYSEDEPDVKMAFEQDG
jgi:hypothetical protein